MTDLSKLRERVLAATGPSRKLFTEICEALLGEYFASENPKLWAFIEAKAWTDAALALVERLLPGWTVGPLVWQPRLIPPTASACLGGGLRVEAKTLPLAIIAALLGALEAEHE